MIQKVLVANRGEIAIRIFYTLREMGIAAVAVFTDPDKHALHVRSADQSVQIASYLDPNDIVRAAKESGSDAIHPGYGFLSENVSLATACEASGVKFIGPLPDTIRRMGDKVESKRIMQKAGVPVVQSWDKAPPQSEFPVLVKAVGGGGGKGMRLVERPAELDAAMAAASREAGKAFGDDRVFVEKYIKNPRHIEFQVLGDTHGNVIHVFERECSIQRRHQKIIEETPSPALTPELRSRMGEAAVLAARAVNYVNAGTVEFIVGPGGQFHFLEMNTRLQVEHPVTEMTTGLDLVREQISIANGKPLSVSQADLRQTGHAMECRIYAEVPEENFRPDVGSISIFRTPAGPGVRLDSGVQEGSEVTFHYDPMLAKLIVWAGSREACIDRMSRALTEFVLLGVRNNIEFLNRIVSHEEFRRGHIDTQFIERHPELLRPVQTEIPIDALLAASLGAGKAGPAQTPGAGAPAFSDVWTSGPWRIS
jgi:acetyl/propionyl-CoA carboxylase alpha subunit